MNQRVYVAPLDTYCENTITEKFMGMFSKFLWGDSKPL